MRLSMLPEAEHWYMESLRSKTDHIPAHLTYGKLLALTVSSCLFHPLEIGSPVQIEVDRVRGTCSWPVNLDC